LLHAIQDARRVADPRAELERLRHDLQSRSDPVKAACAQALGQVLACLSQRGIDRAAEYAEALVAYAGFRETLRNEEIPRPSLQPDVRGALTADWLLREAPRFAQALGELDMNPVRSVLSYLRLLPVSSRGDTVAEQELRWRIALLVPRTAALTVRGVKEGRYRTTAYLRLLELARWAAERALRSPHALETVVLPAVQAVVAYHDLQRARQRPDPPKEPPGYLQQGYLDAYGRARVLLFRAEAAYWAEQMANDRLSASQIRHFFHEIRRLELMARGGGWERAWPGVLSLAPLAAAAVARGLKEQHDYRALELMVRLNVAHLEALPEPERRQAFLEGMVPHFEAILAIFNALTRGGLGPPPAVQALRGTAADLRDAAARRRAEILRQGGISTALLRRIYAHVRSFERLEPAARPAAMARLVVLTDDSLRRSEGNDDGKAELRRLVREGLDPRSGNEGDEFRQSYLPHWESVVAWFVGLGTREGVSHGHSVRADQRHHSL
jgi:CRISPR/Cas system CSM-associated protein Csm2 small subunit